jgi:hypothetical protein
VHAPFAEAGVLAPRLLAQAPESVRSQWLPRVAGGEVLVVPALQERAARYRLAHVGTRAERRDAGWVLTGTKNVVPAGDEADAFVVPARIAGAVDAEDGIGLFLVEASALAARPLGYPTQDGARAAELLLADTPATLLHDEGFEALEAAQDAAIAAQCAEGVGLMDRLVAVTVEYMNTRRQFGVPIASFQALRHRMADVKMALELGRSMSWFATLKLAEPRAARRRAVAQARVQLGRSMRQVGQECVQMHGGIGVTDEYIASHLFKRLTMLEFAGGDTLHHLGEVSARMQDSAGVFA